MRRFPGVEVDKVMDFVRDRFPREVHEFKRLLIRHRAEAIELMTDLVEEALDMLETKREDPARFERMMELRALDRKSEDQAEAVQRAEGEDREHALAALRGTLGEAFAIKQALMREDLAHLERELKELKNLIEKREKNGDAIIERRLSVLTGEEDELEW